MDKQQQHPLSQGQTGLAQTPPKKKKTVMENLSEWLFFLDKPAKYIDELVYKSKHIPETNFAIGKEMANNGNYKDAVFRLKLCLWFDPNHQQANFFLANSYIALGDTVKASHYMHKAVTLDPTDERAVFLLATINSSMLSPELIPPSMPVSVALDYFNNVALTYEAMQHDAGYRAHQFADEAVWDNLDRRRSNYTVLELGCGTGLCGMLLAEHAEELTGVDFAKNMLDIAKSKRRPDNRRVYTETMFQDIRHFVADIQEAQYDAILAVHVLNYIGEISSLFTGIAKGLKENGVCVLQVERYYDENQYGLLQGMGRYGHGDNYMRGYLHHVGLELISADIIKAYPDYDLMQYVARKPETVE